VKKLVRRLPLLRKRDDGASAVEYGLLIALIAVVVSVGAAALGGALNGLFGATATCVANAAPNGC
jgi:pilus assembly protein Flp/PilA